MSVKGFIRAKHTKTGIVADIPQSYLKLFPDMYAEISENDYRKLELEREEEKTIYALDEPAKKPVRAATKKEGK